MSWAAWIGRTETQRDVVGRDMLARMAATLGVATPDQLPPLWHWTLFQNWVSPGELGPDGHPKRGGFLPPVDHLPRRMWAGGRVRLQGALGAGEAVERVSTILDVREKQGASGALVFVTVRHRIEGAGGAAIEEEQDIVYRGTEGAAVKAAEPVTERWSDRTGEVVPDPVTLFRYSALTGNGHRIHYDLDYVREVEGYPGLVVHGPLQATWLAGLLSGERIASLRFRGLRPAFHGRRLTLEGRRTPEGWSLRSVDESGAVCMTAEASGA